MKSSHLASTSDASLLRLLQPAMFKPLRPWSAFSRMISILLKVALVLVKM